MIQRRPSKRTTISWKPLDLLRSVKDFIVTFFVLISQLSAPLQYPHPHVFRCLIYPTGALRSYPLLASVSRDGGDCPPFWPEDVDVGPWFPSGFQTEVINHIPGTRYRLNNSFTVYYSRNVPSSASNFAISRMCHRNWSGNVIVVKLGSKQNNVIQVAWGEGALVDAIVCQWVVRCILHFSELIFISLSDVLDGYDGK